MKHLVWILATIIPCALLGGCSSSRGPVAQGEPAPDFSFSDQSGKQQALSGFRGRVVLVNFWATWCPPCREEMPSMEQLSRRMAGRPFVIIALSVDESWEPVRQFMKQNGFTLPVHADFDKEISSTYGTFTYPETYIVDKKGKVAYKVVGGTNWMSSEILKFLDLLTVE